MSDTRRRPMSPHLWIHRWDWTMVLSIAHRATGVGLAGGAAILALWLVATALGGEPSHWSQWFFGSWIGVLALLGWTWALFFHLCNGIRHLVWDTGRSFELANAEIGAFLVIVVSTTLTLAAWIAGYLQW